MTIDDFRDHLQRLGLPVAYREWESGEEPKLPYLLFYRDESNDFIADNYNYLEGSRMSLELYTEIKDFEQEEAVNQLLQQLEIPYQVFEGNLDSEKMYEVLYEFII